ncbi:dickkopf-related protein 2-like [Oryzias latipes]|uniref:dickkopf-related protein 2-like n=1 Tax=Oryzias latipes TaxID=8090 RepID=UPI0009D92FFB|nr:dickkopf-related protein 2-like [Oryzias latipes]
MWLWRSVLCVSAVWSLALDSNIIQSSKEATLQSSEQTRGGCSNRAQRRPLARDGPADAHVHRDVDTPMHGFNRTKGAEMAACVRSGDCAEGLCCVRYLTGKRCQRIPLEGDACLLRAATKLKRTLGRCACAAGLTCTTRPAGAGKNKRQGVCAPSPSKGKRNTRHSGKKRRTAEWSC